MPRRRRRHPPAPASPRPSPANAFRLAELRDLVKPFRLHFFTSLRSTSDHAAAMRRQGELFAPSIVLAARQTAGRGRGANTWFSAAGSITATFALPVDPTLAPHHLPLAAGLAVRDAAAELSGDAGIGLKWPNDVVVESTRASRGGRAEPARRGARPPLLKLAGLLCERIDHVDLIGVGLNVNRPAAPLPPELAARVAFLQDVRDHIAGVGGGNQAGEGVNAGDGNTEADGGRQGDPEANAWVPIDLTTALAAVARHLHRLLVRRAETPFPALLRAYDRHHALVGRTLAVHAPGEPPAVGRCEGLDPTGRLLLRSGKTLHKIVAGHVELR